jgi:hypothetical protein
MGRATTEKVGRGPCPNASCGETVTYRKSAGGMLCHKCDCCDSSGYAEPGGAAYVQRLASVKGTDPAPPPVNTSPVPAAKKRPSFDMAAL